MTETQKPSEISQKGPKKVPKKLSDLPNKNTPSQQEVDAILDQHMPDVSRATFQSRKQVDMWRDYREGVIQDNSVNELGELNNVFKLGLLQRLFVHINAFLYGNNTSDSIKINSSEDIEKIKNTFRGIINFEDSNIDLEIGKTVKYDMDRGILEILSGEGESQVTESSFRIDAGDPNRKPTPIAPLREGQESEYGLARELGQFVKENGPYTAGGKNSCGEAVGQLLCDEVNKKTGKPIGFGIEGLPSSGRNGNKYTKILEDRPNQFRREKVSDSGSIEDFRKIKPGGIIVYTGNGKKYRKNNGSQANQDFGHVEIKDIDGNYTSFYTSRNPGGSARFDPRAPESFQEQTGWTGYVYYPISKELPQAFKGAEKRDKKKK